MSEMPKLYKECGMAVVTAIEPVEETEIESWEWRLRNIGREGLLTIYTSEVRHPGEYFIQVGDADDHLRTSCGKLTIDGNEIELTTRHSRYRFRLKD